MRALWLLVRYGPALYLSSRREIRMSRWDALMITLFPSSSSSVDRVNKYRRRDGKPEYELRPVEGGFDVAEKKP